MAYNSYLTIRDMVVTYNGVEIERNRLNGFVIESQVLANMRTNLNAASGSINATFQPFYRPQNDLWDYYTSARGDVSDIFTGLSLYYDHFKDGAVGDIIWYYNRNNPGFRIGWKYGGIQTVNGQQSAFAYRGIFMAGTATWDTNKIMLAGKDNNGYDRDVAIGFVVDSANGWAFPYFMSVYDGGSNVTRGAECWAWWTYSRNNWNSARYYYYALFGDVVLPSTNPYSPGGTSEGTNEGTGDFDDTNDPIPLPLTSGQYSAVGAGFVNLFTLDQTQVLDFGNFLFDPTSDFTDILRLFDNVLDSVISFGILPFTPSGGTANQPINLASVDTGAKGTRLSSQFETVDCGSVDITEFYGAALDYAPYTNIELVLPYCGTVRLAPEEVMGKTISVEYHVDCLTGACIAFVYDGDRVLSQVPGNVLSLVPYTSGDFRQAHAALLGIVGTVGAGLVTAMTGGMTAPMLAAGGASLATNVINMKGHIARGGGSAGASGYMRVQTPYIVITRPRQCLPDADSEYQGLPLYTYELLGDLSGFTKVRDVHLQGIDCTEAELAEIETLLKEGVIL